MNTNTVGSEFLGTYQPQVVLTGAAEENRLRLVDPKTIECYEYAYSFEVFLPCSLWDIGILKCYINSDGNVHVHVTTEGGEISGRSSPILFNRKLRRISPPAPFCISFSFPGTVEPNFNRTNLTADGNFETIVLKAGLPPAL